MCKYSFAFYLHYQGLLTQCLAHRDPAKASIGVKAFILVCYRHPSFRQDNLS